MSSRRKVILDTDIGTDIDDAACLAWLLAQAGAGRCDLLGITTVCSDVVARARLASALCWAAGRDDITIHAGVERPLLISPLHGRANQAEALARWDHRTDFIPGNAVGFLRDTIYRHPHEIDLLAIGPLTNIAALFACHPETAALLKSITLMGGVVSGLYWGSPMEYNFYCDPHAAQIVLQSGAPHLRVVPLDVTTKLVMKATEVRSRFTHPLLRVVADFSKSWFAHREELTFHDPLTAVTLFNENVCAFSPCTLEIELGAERLKGYLHWQPDAPDAIQPGSHQIALGVAPDVFFDDYFAAFDPQPAVT
ncbi:nucleoside hydrolase [Geminisphaera colitermitum]|uniref:nucleoside hydrolase n=1 Tax=Geminisphaera colitermitum TaxID=1148786 RepID=UPI000158CCAE|nr:nucleoside hydrolase [Geminisphaera colitermitum]